MLLAALFLLVAAVQTAHGQVEYRPPTIEWHPSSFDDPVARSMTVTEGETVTLNLQITDLDPRWIATGHNTYVGVERIVSSADASDFSMEPAYDSDSPGALNADHPVLIIEVTAEEDDLIEGPETGYVCFYGVGGDYSFLAATRCVLLNILDDDYAVVRITGGAAPRTVDEGDALEVELTADLGGRRIVDHLAFDVFSSGSGTASDDDYTALSERIILSAANPWSTTVTLQTTEDLLVEPDETLSIALSVLRGFEGAVRFEPAATIPITIVDDDTATMTLSGPSEVEEGSDATMTLRLSNPLPHPFAMYWAVGLAHRDLEETAGRLDFAARETEKTFTISTIDDAVVEGDETFLVYGDFFRFGAVPGLEMGAVRDGVSLTVTDNDTATVSVEPTEVEVTEGGAVTLTARLGAVAATDVSVSWSTVDVTATAGTDYVAQAATTLTFGPGQREKTITVQTIQDELDELSEQFEVRFAVPEGSPASLTSETVAVTVLDDDRQGALSVLPPSGPVAEGDAAEFALVLSQAPSNDATVWWLTRNGTADHSDYTAVTGGTGQSVTFATGEKEKTITVQTTADSAVEGNETFDVEVVATLGIATLLSYSATATILDDDTATVSVSGPSAPVAEGGVAEFTVTLSAEVASAVTLWAATFATGPQSAGSTEFEPVARSLEFAPGETEKTLTVQTYQDTVVEGDETFALGLTADSLPLGVTIGAAQAVATIVDDDTLTASVADVTVSESAGAAVLTVALSQQAERAVTLSYAASDGDGDGRRRLCGGERGGDHSGREKRSPRLP